MGEGEKIKFPKKIEIMEKNLGRGLGKNKFKIKIEIKAKKRPTKKINLG